MKKLTRGQLIALLEVALKEPPNARSSQLQSAIEKIKYGVAQKQAHPRRRRREPKIGELSAPGGVGCR